MQLRQYQRTAAACESAQEESQMPTGTMADWYYEFQDEDWLDGLRRELNAMQRYGAPQTEIDKQQAHIEAFEDKMDDVARERRMKGRRRD